MTTATMQTFAFTIATSAALNSNQRDHHHVKADKVRVLRAIGAACVKATPHEPMTRAHAHCWLSFGDKRRRDANNFWPTAKAWMDGATDAGLLPDDDSTHLIGPDMRIGPVGTRGLIGVRFTFEEIAS